ncbi:unnamed protein product [Diabrotica balteata]|uniref:Uncharacterized protein n=1 Tax=Diabrotica balteata TaxID=107213 RepID=A0A9N9SQM2_DIABA|nr:unnamed protein product [Diabrotica balteata]
MNKILRYSGEYGLSLNIKKTKFMKISKNNNTNEILYGAESWTLNRNTINRLNAFEIWTFRRLLRIPWEDRVTNAEVLRRIGRERKIENTISQTCNERRRI